MLVFLLPWLGCLFLFLGSYENNCFGINAHIASGSSHIRNGWGQHCFKYVKFSDMWYINLYTASSTFFIVSKAHYFTFFRTYRKTLKTNDWILELFFIRSVTVELPIPTTLLVFSLLASLSSMLNLFSSDRTHLCFIHVHFYCCQRVVEMHVVNHVNVT